MFSGADLSCIRGEREVFRHLDFGLDAGGMLVLTGPNGSGKSTLLRLMAGLLSAEQGAMTWNGVATSDDPEAHNARLHYVGHLDAIKPALDVTENLLFWASMHGGNADAASRVSNALTALDIGFLSDTPAQYLSAGQRRRVALARILASPARIWLLDEPTTALDKHAMATLEQIIADHRAAGGMVVVSTHTAIAGDGQAVLDLAPFAAHAQMPTGEAA
ncbi:MAG: heme ABC exporter ATP-binding protein CcmA [Rhodospirillales bacterium]|jgi:heme exporter protein A|nr:heme ABC exporter ATP-binding protein CcmA [Rhodospirillales bacterium]MBT4041783.1 heme ABC exporter ATP-binding protein CcmA [Rhodospirillales bacterium]MBT4628487.1 heme ABC exporter ATP-binding protein CcmA [Rhodospirillales bacterium]MBT5520737.1 heme ABC exporter ATP-binding protein CcmA [Rhodospirillales bacterium]MBT6110809.1 heme ABC exporter ATP-binding protein CcmA [Rhodospirillales bacterium]